MADDNHPPAEAPTDSGYRCAGAGKDRAMKTLLMTTALLALLAPSLTAAQEHTRQGGGDGPNPKHSEGGGREQRGPSAAGVTMPQPSERRGNTGMAMPTGERDRPDTRRASDPRPGELRRETMRRDEARPAEIRREIVRDQRENAYDRRDNARDRRDIVRDQRENVRDQRETFRDQRHNDRDHRDNVHNARNTARWNNGRWGGRPVYAPAYSYPRGYSYRRWHSGGILPALFFGSSYYYNAFDTFGLSRPPYGFRWVRYGPDLLLVNIRTGRIRDVRYGVFG